MNPDQASVRIPVVAKIPSLDGLRAISIVLVLLGHAYGTRGYAKTTVTVFAGSFSHFGVVVFFIISGFLITALLMQERERTGSIDLLAFYIRRSLRIMPAFFCFIFAIALADYLHWVAVPLSDYLHALTFTMNYVVTPAWNLGHVWSLSVEEQFYLIWPFAFSRLSMKRAALVAAAMFAAAPVIRAAMHIAIPSGAARDLPIFPAVADPIAIGCLMAIVRTKLLQSKPYLRFTSSPAMLLLLVPILVVNKFGGYTFVDLFGTPVVLASVAVVIEASTRRGQSLPGRLLNSRLVVFVGVLSYSLYLWQQPFLNRSGSSSVNSFPINLVLACACALASYTFVEKPLLRMRRRWASRTPISRISV